MPELPEVDAIAGVARKYAPGNTIKMIEVLRGNGKYLWIPKRQRETVTCTPGHADVSDIYRRGKFIVFELTSGAYFTVHNAMTGYLDWEHEPWTFDYVEGKRKAGQSDVRVEISLGPGDETLRFHDARLFGRLKYIEKPDLAVGPEALETDRLLPKSPVMTKDDFVYRVTQWNGPIKPMLMDQRFMAGVGNIYAAEACGWAGFRPDRDAVSLRNYEAQLLFETVQELLKHNVPTIRYNWLRFYRKKVCLTCEKGICKIEQEGRTTWFCPHCQK